VRPSRRPLTVVALLGVALLGVALAACSGGGSGTGSGGGGPTGTGQARGARNPARGEPLQVGFVNMEVGAQSLPELRIGAEVGATYVNEQLGGIAGRPVTYLRCDVEASPAAAIDCANKMVEAKVAFVREGVDVAGDAMLPILSSAGIPLVGHVAFGPKQLTDPDAFFLGVPTPAGALAPLQYFAGTGRHSVAFVVADLPGARALPLFIAPVAAKLGLAVTSAFYPPDSPDWNVLVAAAMAHRPDVIAVPLATENDCTGFVRAARGAGYAGGLFAGSCSTFVTSVGHDAAGVVTYSDRWRPEASADAPEPTRSELQTFVDAMKSAGQSRSAVGLAPLAFGDTIDLARILSAVEGPLDGRSVAAALHATRDFDTFAGPAITCDGSAWKGENGCSRSVLFFEAQADGTMRALSKDFVDVSTLAGG
jgi:branched-chain amino acid transport system substrate-binding protein